MKLKKKDFFKIENLKELSLHNITVLPRHPWLGRGTGGRRPLPFLDNRELYIRAKVDQTFIEKEKHFAYKHLSLAEFEGGPAHNKRFHARHAPWALLGFRRRSLGPSC